MTKKQEMKVAGNLAKILIQAGVSGIPEARTVLKRILVQIVGGDACGGLYPGSGSAKR